MKIAKHCHEECASDIIVAQGALLGLVVDDCLEITNCFAFPKSVDESINDGKLFFDITLQQHVQTRLYTVHFSFLLKPVTVVETYVSPHNVVCRISWWSTKFFLQSGGLV